MSTTRVARAVRHLKEAVAELESALDAEATYEGELARWRRALTLVEAEGGRLSRERWHEIGREVGYDVRGLGGFFRGDGASMRVEGAEYVLTDAGKEYLDQYGRLNGKEEKDGKSAGKA